MVDELFEAVRNVTEPYFPGGFTLRDEANAIVAKAFRRGPIEALHAGKDSELLQFDHIPESDAVIHAWARTTVRFDAPCKTVKGEVLARIAGKNGWVDPHNAGTYALTSSVGDVVAANHVTGNGKYTDKLQFMFENADGGDDCEVSGCSVSQVARGVHNNHSP